MNQTTVRELHLRSLARRVANARSAVAHHTIDRDAATRRDGIAHPRSIYASRRLSRTESAYRDLLTSYRVRASEDAHTGRRVCDL